MAGFFLRHVSLRHTQGRRLRALRIRFARKRRVLRRARRSLEALQAAAAEIEARNRRIREENEITSTYNSLADKWVHDLLNGFDDDP